MTIIRHRGREIPGEITLTTTEFRRGQEQAVADWRRGSSGPNDDALARAHPEFAAGYRHEWTEYLAHLTSPATDDSETPME